MNSNGVPNVNMTTTIAAMAEQMRIHTKLQAFFNVGGINGQPMLRLADNVQQMLLARRMGWKFNRVDLGSNNPAVNPHFFMTQQGFQDFHHAGANCFTLINSTTPGGQLPAGGAGVDQPGFKALLELARTGRVAVKLSGFQKYSALPPPWLMG